MDLSARANRSEALGQPGLMATLLAPDDSAMRDLFSRLGAGGRGGRRGMVDEAPRCGALGRGSRSDRRPPAGARLARGRPPAREAAPARRGALRTLPRPIRPPAPAARRAPCSARALLRRQGADPVRPGRARHAGRHHGPARAAAPRRGPRRVDNALLPRRHEAAQPRGGTGQPAGARARVVGGWGPAAARRRAAGREHWPLPPRRARRESFARDGGRSRAADVKPLRLAQLYASFPKPTRSKWTRAGRSRWSGPAAAQRSGSGTCTPARRVARRGGHYPMRFLCCLPYGCQLALLEKSW
jgi:hypothetical protein